LKDDAKTWADAGPLKVKYPVNAENFKTYFIEGPLNNLKNFGRRPIPKAKAFE